MPEGGSWWPWRPLGSWRSSRPDPRVPLLALGARVSRGPGEALWPRVARCPVFTGIPWLAVSSRDAILPWWPWGARRALRPGNRLRAPRGRTLFQAAPEAPNAPCGDQIQGGEGPSCQRRHRGFFLHFFCSGTFLIPARSQRWRSDRGSLRKAGVGRRTLASESGRNSCYLVTAGVLGTGAGPACQVTTWFVGSDAHRF